MNGAHHPGEREHMGGGRMNGQSTLRLVWIYPDLLSTYGDRGNLIMLTRRARLRGLNVEPVEVTSDQPVPSQGDIYLLGGGEDLPQVLAAQRLRAGGGLNAAAANGAVIFAVCAGYQLIGNVFGGAQGEPVDGLGILDISSNRGEKRGVGEILADVDPALGVEQLTGFENHQGVTRLGQGARPLARTIIGIGNGDGTEGAYAGPGPRNLPAWPGARSQSRARRPAAQLGRRPAAAPSRGHRDLDAAAARRAPRRGHHGQLTNSRMYALVI